MGMIQEKIIDPSYYLNWWPLLINFDSGWEDLKIDLVNDVGSVWYCDHGKDVRDWADEELMTCVKLYSSIEEMMGSIQVIKS